MAAERKTMPIRGVALSLLLVKKDDFDLVNSDKKVYNMNSWHF